MSRADCPQPLELESYAKAREGFGAPDASSSANSAAANESAASRASIELHAAGCADCRLALAALGILIQPETAAETALLDRLVTSPPRLDLPRVAAPDAISRKRAGPRWARLSAIALASSGAVAAAVLVLIFNWHANDSASALLDLQDGSRPLEAAFSDLPYAPYRPQRGAGARTNSAVDARFDRSLRQLLEAREAQRPGAVRMLATLYALRGSSGDSARAERLIEDAGRDADGENDRAVLLFGRGDLPAALEACDRALEQDGRHRAARFNRALFIEKLGFAISAADAYEALARDDAASPWAAEAKDRAARLRSPPPHDEADLASARRSALVALLAAGSEGDLAHAEALIAALPAGLQTDLLRLDKLARGFSPAALALHGRLFSRYQQLRSETLSGSASLAAMHALIDDASSDPLILVPVLQLAAFRHGWRDERRSAQELQLRVLRVCRESGCDAINEAIAADELAEEAGRDGDFVSAHRLQDRAEARFASVAAGQQLGELEQKRASLLLEEGRLEEAMAASIRALKILAPLRTPGAVVAQALAASGAAVVAAVRQEHRTALELHRAGLSLLAGTDAADSSADLATAAAVDIAELGRPKEALPMLREELQKQSAAGHRLMAGQLLTMTASIELQEHDPAAALQSAKDALAAFLEGGEGSEWRDRLATARVVHARALVAAAPPGDAAARLAARQELQLAVDSAVQAARNSEDNAAPLALARRGIPAAIELAALGVDGHAPAAELLLPLDSLRDTVFSRAAHSSMTASWPEKLPSHSCLLALLPAADSLIRIAVARGSSEARALSTSRAQLDKLILDARRSRPDGTAPDPDAPTAAEESLASAIYGDSEGGSALPEACSSASEIWLWVEAPLDAIDASALPLPRAFIGHAAIGFVTSLSRLFAPEPAWPPPADASLFISGAEPLQEDGERSAALPATDSERESLRAALGAGLLDLSGPALTPDALLARLPQLQFLHAAVHGSAGSDGAGGALQLSGELGRLSAREIATARLLPTARIVLSACHAAPGESGLVVALARSGALEIASAEGAVDDSAAAAWSAAFYPALARGLSFAQAAREANATHSPSGARARFVVTH